MGQTHDIPRDQWDAFFGAVAKSEIHRHVWVEVESPEFGAQRVAEERPFAGISLDHKGGDTIDVVVETDAAGRSFEHVIEHAERVYALEGDDGRLTCLDIETGATHTRLLFH